MKQINFGLDFTEIINQQKKIQADLLKSAENSNINAIKFENEIFSY